LNIPFNACQWSFEFMAGNAQEFIHLLLCFVGSDHPCTHSSLFLRKDNAPEQGYNEAEDHPGQSTEKPEHCSALLSASNSYSQRIICKHATGPAIGLVLLVSLFF
jgi:hypothetical protein